MYRLQIYSETQTKTLKDLIQCAGIIITVKFQNSCQNYDGNLKLFYARSMTVLSPSVIDYNPLYKV